MKRAPLTDTIAIVISQMVDDSLLDTKREPSHSDLDFQFGRFNLLAQDPKQLGRPVGKAKRVRAVLIWAIDNELEAGEQLVYQLISLIKSLGGFRDSSPNYIGKEVILNAINAFNDEGYTLTSDGNLTIKVLENLEELDINTLKAYARRAKKGVSDAALLTGTSKDLMEAVAAHIVLVKWNSYPSTINFPTLLGQAFTTLGLATTNDNPIAGELAQKRVERAIYELACSINKLRNKEGTGHGRPFIPTVTETEAILSIESIGIISEFLLSKL